MSVFGITNRYASALLKQAEEIDKFEQISADVQLVYDTIDGSKDLRVLLESPIVAEDKKQSILKELFSDKVGKECMNFLMLVVDKNREDILFEITERYLELRDDKMNVVPVSITTAVSLSDSDRELFQESLEEYTGKKLRTNYTVNDKIIGGFLVKIKDKMLDASILQQLNLLKKRLVKSDQSLVN